MYGKTEVIIVVGGYNEGILLNLTTDTTANVECPTQSDISNTTLAISFFFNFRNSSKMLKKCFKYRAECKRLSKIP